MPKPIDALKTLEIPQDDTDSVADEPVWDPVAQIYVGGKIPENAAIKEMIANNGGSLRLFGYGSLCWNPGNPGESALAHSSVMSCAGQARGFRRAWAQKSTDHRGVPSFPGLVCTLLREDEYQSFRPTVLKQSEESLTEGLIYEVPPDLVEDCLDELDFREKGGYARDIVDVLVGSTGKIVQALLYRGTPENPAFWPRALCDLPFAAAVMSAASGPSGDNMVYLNQLDEFLKNATSCPTILENFDDTLQLASMAKDLRQYDLHFFVGCGSNQHNQLLLNRHDNVAGLMNNGEDTYELKESIVCTPLFEATENGKDPVVNIFAGSAHSAILTRNGRLFGFGWNEAGQLGCSESAHQEIMKVSSPLPVVCELAGVLVACAALGFSHTLVVEKNTGKLLVFGDNRSGQVDGDLSSNKNIAKPVTPKFLEDEHVSHVAAGLFHSAVITTHGELVVFGGTRSTLSQSTNEVVCRWQPDSGKYVRVACGHRHTVVLDDSGRMWAIGNNKYGQLGCSSSSKVEATKPTLVDYHLDGFHCYDVLCGWSHSVALFKDQSGTIAVVGWGRNDKGQLGTGTSKNVLEPMLLFQTQKILSVSCGSEFTTVVNGDEEIWCCGWNEHGNLATSDCADRLKLSRASGAPTTTTPGYSADETQLAVAAGGAHLLAMRIEQ